MGIKVQRGIAKVDGELFNAVEEQRRLRLQAWYFPWQAERIVLFISCSQGLGLIVADGLTRFTRHH